MRPYREIHASDVGREMFYAFNAWWSVEDFIGAILPGDVGKRVFMVGDILQVENDEQRARRLDHVNQAAAAECLKRGLGKGTP